MALWFNGITIGLVACTLRRWPQHYWLMSLANAMVYVPSWFCERRRRRELWFVADFCIVHMLVLIAWLAFSGAGKVPPAWRRTALLPNIPEPSAPVPVPAVRPATELAP